MTLALSRLLGLLTGIICRLAEVPRPVPPAPGCASGSDDWSTGPVEGHINRLKRLKRQMFGRARLDLLARRFLLAACSGTAPPCRARVYARMASSTLITKTGQPPV